MDVVISGNGISSKVLTVLLSSSKKVKSIKVIDKFNRIENNEISHQGLWGPSLHILKQLNVLDELQPYYINKSSYRSTDGFRLAKPATDLLPNVFTSLAFVESSQLLKALDKKIEDAMKSDSTLNVQYMYNDTITTIQRDTTKKVTIETKHGQLLSADLLVAADGSYSRVKELLYPNQHPLQYRGYKVYRGFASSEKLKAIRRDEYHHSEATILSPLSSSSTTTTAAAAAAAATISHYSPILYDPITHHYIEGFQTWGLGTRFAAVPTSTGNQWYCAITTPPPASSDIHQSYNWTTLQNGSYPVTSTEEYNHLLSILSSWHYPISDLILCTDKKTIRGHYAYASDKCILGGLSTGTLYHGIAFIGDAAHTLDPILALGTGCAIEDAWNLSYQLFSPNHSRTTTTATSNTINAVSGYVNNERDSISDVCNIDFLKALYQYEKYRTTRINRLHHISNISQYFGHIDNPTVLKLRDNMIQSINRLPLGRQCIETIFDQFIHLVSDSKIKELL